MVTFDFSFRSVLIEKIVEDEGALFWTEGSKFMAIRVYIFLSRQEAACCRMESFFHALAFRQRRSFEAYGRFHEFLN